MQIRTIKEVELMSFEQTNSYVNQLKEGRVRQGQTHYIIRR